MWCWGGSFGGVWVCVVEQVKEVASSEGLHLLGPTLTYRNSLERPRSVPMQPYLGSVVLCLISTSVVGFKVLRSFYANCGESVQPLQS